MDNLEKKNTGFNAFDGLPLLIFKNKAENEEKTKNKLIAPLPVTLSGR